MFFIVFCKLELKKLFLITKKNCFWSHEISLKEIVTSIKHLVWCSWGQTDVHYEVHFIGYAEFPEPVRSPILTGTGPFFFPLMFN